MTRVYILRHGETHENKENKVAGHYNSQLTELGKAQARATAKVFESIHIDKVYSSDLDRAYETAVLATGGRIEVEKRPALREMYLGEWEGKNIADLDRDYPEERAVWHEEFGKCRPTGGESAEETRERMVSAIRQIALENEGKTVLVVSHGGAIGCLIQWATGIPTQEMSKRRMPGNACVCILEIENGEPTLVKGYDNSHLGDMATELPKNI